MPQPLIEPGPDAAPLGWLVGEIRVSTEAAAAGIRRFLDGGADVEALREAREQIHQAAGAVRMLDLRGAARMLDSIERLIRHWESAPGDCNGEAVQKFDVALRALFAYLEGLRAGRVDQPIRLYPHYREIQQLASAARLHPADLLFPT